MKLGLFGGRFDPPHLGHLLTAQHALETLELDELWFVPAPAPPHKQTVAPAEARYTMLVLATASHPALRVSRLELERPGTSYSIDTVLEVQRRLPEATLHFITGIDAYADIAHWHRAEELVSLVTMVAAPRPGYSLQELAPFFRQRVHVLPGLPIAISSSSIRQRLQQHQPIRYLVPELVESYLAKHHFYC